MEPEPPDDQIDRRRSVAEEIQRRLAALEGVGGQMAALTAAVIGLGTAIGNMASKEDVAAAAAEEARKRKRSIILLGLVVVLLVVPIIGQAVVLNDLHDIATTNQENGRILVECTTPSPSPEEAERLLADGGRDVDLVHECYERGQNRTADFLAQLSLALLDAATCARVQEDPGAIGECYATRVEARTGSRPPTE